MTNLRNFLRCTRTVCAKFYGRGMDGVNSYFDAPMIVFNFFKNPEGIDSSIPKEYLAIIFLWIPKANYYLMRFLSHQNGN